MQSTVYYYMNDSGITTNQKTVIKSV